MVVSMKISVYTWSGKHFGYRIGNTLFTHQGVEIGRFDGDVIYGKDGLYLGELKNEKLVAEQSRILPRKSSFNARLSGRRLNFTGSTGPAMPYGYEDFTDPDDFQ